MGTVRGLSTTEQGYGIKHQRLRKRLALKVERGEVFCARCHGWIPPDKDRAPCPRCGKVHRTWHLGHDDHDRSQYTGPEHECCNCGTAGRDRAPRPRPVRADWW